MSDVGVTCGVFGIGLPRPRSRTPARRLVTERAWRAGAQPVPFRRLSATTRRFARAVLTRWRAMFLLAGAVLTVLGVMLGSAAVLIPGVLLLLFAVLYGIGASGCTSADLLAGWPWRG